MNSTPILVMVLLAGLSDYLFLYFLSASPGVFPYILGICLLPAAILPWVVDRVFPNTN